MVNYLERKKMLFISILNALISLNSALLMDIDDISISELDELYLDEESEQNDETTFKEYRMSIDNENDSNMIKIDDKFGEVDDNVKNIKTKTEMDELYLPQRTDNGVMPSLDCVIDSNAINYQIWGNSYQKTGKNLFNMNISEPYKTGIISIDGNSIVYNGAWYILNKINLKAGTTITCSFNMSGYDDTVSISNKWRIQYSDSTYSDTIESGTSLLLSKDMTNLIIYVSQGATVTATISNIQLELGSKATPYEPYIEMPSPEHPSEIQSVGDKSKNLLKVSITPTTMGGVTLSKVDDYYVLNGIATGSGNFTSSKMDIEEGIYTFSANNNECSHIDYPIIQLYDDIIEKTMNVLDNKVNNFTTGTIQKGSYRFRIRIEKGITYENYIIKPQLELGNVVTSYEPYGYKIPISICGKNYINSDSIFGKYKQPDGSYLGDFVKILNTRVYIPINLINKQLTYSIMVSCTGDLKSVQIVTNDRGKKIYSATKVDAGEGYKKIFFTFTPTGSSENIWWSYSSGSGDVSIKDIQLEEGQVATDYEPYREENINIYLNEPLRKIGDVYDYIDFKRGVVVRVVKERLFNGSENWTNYPTGVNQYGFYSFMMYLSDGMTNTDISIYSNYYSWMNVGFLKTDKVSCLYSNKLLYLRDNNFTNVNDFKAWLAEKNTNGEPLNVFYILGTPIEEPITLPYLPLQDGTNNIISNTTIQPSNMQINYYQNLTDLINKIKQAIISGGGNV